MSISATVFDYTVTPSQVPVGGAGGAASVTLTVTVTNNSGQDQPCTGIAFTFPSALGGSIQSSSTDSSSWGIGQGSTANSFTALPQGVTTGLDMGMSVGFTFSGVVTAAVPGAAAIAILEQCGQPRDGTVTVTLASAGLGITEFAADALYVVPGTTVTFTWATLDADSVVLDWGDGRHIGGTAGSFGFAVPAETITATLTAIKQGASGPSPTAQLVVTVQTPKITSYTAAPQPAVVAQRGLIELAWTTLHAKSCTLVFYPSAAANEPLAAASPIDVPTSATGYAVNPMVSGSYELSAVSTGGESIPQQRNVTVASVVASLTVSPSVVAAVGDGAALSWSTSWSSGVTLDGSPVDASGSTSVVASGYDVHTLVANGYDPQTETATLLVVPVITMLDLGVGFYGDGLSVGWYASGAVAVTLSGYSGALSPSNQEPSALVALTDGQLSTSTLVFTGATGNTVAVVLDAMWSPPSLASPHVIISGDSLNVPGSRADISLMDGIQVSGTATNGDGSTLGFNSLGDSMLTIAAASPTAAFLWKATCGDGQTFSLSWTVMNDPPPRPVPTTTGRRRDG